MSVATVPRRKISVKARTCGHRFQIYSHLPLAEVENDRTYRCSECDGARRRVNIIHVGARRCVTCKVTKLADGNDDIECFACMEASAREAAKSADERWVEHLLAERAAVLAALPGDVVTIRQRSGVRWVDVTRVLNAAKKAGDVVEWNNPRHMPMYRLVNPPPGEAA